MIHAQCPTFSLNRIFGYVTQEQRQKEKLKSETKKKILFRSMSSSQEPSLVTLLMDYQVYHHNLI